MLIDKEHFAPFDLSALEEWTDTDKDDDNDEEADKSKSIIFDDFGRVCAGDKNLVNSRFGKDAIVAVVVVHLVRLGCRGSGHSG